MAILNFTKLAGGGGASQGLLAIQSESYTTINGYQVPALSAEQVTAAYNAIVGLRGAVILTRDAEGHFLVNQADVVGGDVAITILFYDTLLLTYLVEGDSVQIDGKGIGAPAPTIINLTGYDIPPETLVDVTASVPSGYQPKAGDMVVNSEGRYFLFNGGTIHPSLGANLFYGHYALDDVMYINLYQSVGADDTMHWLAWLQM